MTTSLSTSSLFGLIIVLLCGTAPAWSQSSSTSQSPQNRSSNDERQDQAQDSQRSQSSDRSRGDREDRPLTQEDERSSFDRSERQEQFRDQRGPQDRGRSDQRSMDRQGRSSSDRQSSQRHSSQRQSWSRDDASGSQPGRAALANFKAGYYAGYRAGYVDAQDDYVLWIIDAQKLRRGQQESGQQESVSRADRQRLREQMRGGSGSSSGTASQQFRGEVLRTKQVPLRNTQQTHTLALVESSEGRRRIVDLGPSRQLQDLSIEQGQRISVIGRIARTRDNVPVLLAQRLESDGQSMSIDRPARQQTSDRQGSQQRRSAEESSTSQSRR